MPDFDLKGIPNEAAEVYRPFAEDLLSRFSTSLQSISITGSCLTGDYSPGVSDINSVLVLTKADIGELDMLTSMSHYRKKRIRSPLIMTEDYIARSLDVFPIEFLDVNLFHKTIYGPDRFAEISIEKVPLRLQCEHDLKGKLIHLQRGYVASGGKAAALRGLLLDALPGYFPLMRSLLLLVKGLDPPSRKTEVLTQVESAFHISVSGLREIMALRTSSKFFLDRDHLLNLFKEIYRITYELSMATDALAV